MYTLHNHCRACGYGENTAPDGCKSEKAHEKLIPVLDLGIQPLANDFKSDREEREGFAPLKMMFCPNCTLAQLSVVVKPEILYSNYSYITSMSRTMLRHFGQLVAALGIKNGDRVLEIGSNDGGFLSILKDEIGCQVAGVDPAINLARIATVKGIPTVGAMFSFDSARNAISFHLGGLLPDIIIARHVCCHIDNLRGFINDIDRICGDNTIVAIEVPYVKHLMDKLYFDTIYHEHLSYMSTYAMEMLVSKTSLRIKDVLHFDVHGGVVVYVLSKQPSSWVSDEKRITVEDWNDFSFRCHDAMGNLVQWQRTNDSKSIVGYGASAKSTVWMNACGFRRKHIKFICDNTPQKQWKCSPGTDIPIVDEGALLRELPDYAVLFAWNYADEIIAKNQAYRDKGGKFVVPLPELRVC